MRVRRLLPLLFLAAILPARGALFDDEEARKRIEALRTESNARMEKLEAASRGQIELANQIETLKAEGGYQFFYGSYAHQFVDQ